MPRATIKTNNEDYGFYGTVRCADRGIDVDAAWDKAVGLIHLATGSSEEAIRDFLDSRDGRHFADTVVCKCIGKVSLTSAIKRALNEWQGYKTSIKTQREHGIPAGLPYVTGWVAHYEIARDNA